ncbi:isoflavone reductase family protein [Daldinia decipiens]|uniref:isoflavone reductase family protein n=1 Tax=Daldinia decipiens TaxID=326647 RepID=UPI0020C30E62|nr:isoflavone reductase family protein [Daldinia decipiens]KAI1654535.1 isoflavone reductase family protein [Daldinia decipiens]
MSASPPILLIGAGELGTAVLESLVAHPKRNSGSIAILLRQSSISSQDPAKKAQNDRLKSLGATFEAGDLANDSAEQLAGVFEKYHTIISCSGFGLPPGTQVKLTQAVLQAKARRYIPWQWGIDYDAVGGGSAQDLFDEQLRVRSLLRSQRDTDWIIVSTGLFTSFLFLPAFGVVDLPARKLRALGSWDARLSLTTAADIGRMAAEVAYDPRDVSHQVVYIAGDTVTYARVAELVEGRFGGEWTREVWDVEGLKEKLRERPDDGMLKYTNVWAVGKGVAWDMEKTLNAQRGVELQGLEDYLRAMPDL